MPARVDRIADPWGGRTPYAAGAPWPVRVDTFLEPGVREEDVERWVPSASVLHSNGDGQDIAVKDGRIVGVRGRARDRVNHGRLDPKDLFGWQANGSPDRLTRPLVREGGELVETNWDTAMEHIATRSRALLAEPGGWGRFGFYTSGQLFLEEYYTLAVIGKAGLGTPHMDGNTRLCTATAAAALKASFGTDGQPGSYADVDHCDALALWGHNVAETQTVLWMRMLDRLHGPDRPRLLCVDPRPTPVAREADVHLAPRPGTNVALVNAVLREVLRREWVDAAYVEAHTLGLDSLRDAVEPYTAARAAELCGVPARDIAAAAELVGTCRRLVSTVLQGFYGATPSRARSGCCGSPPPIRWSRCRTSRESDGSCAGQSSSWSSRTCSSRRRRCTPTWCCRPRPGGRRRARSRTPTGRCTCPSRLWSRRARRAPTSTSSSTTRGGWASATATGSR